MAVTRSLSASLAILFLLICLLPGRAEAAPRLSGRQDDTTSGPGRVFLPGISRNECPVTSGLQYGAVPVSSAPTDRPAAAHADLNLALRGYASTAAALGFVNDAGPTDGNAPRLQGCFADGRVPEFRSVYRVYDWNWDCGSQGCRGELLIQPQVTLLGVGTAPGETIRIAAMPDGFPNIYSGGYRALVLYAEERRITLKYTREDNVISGYTVHMEDVCVDPNLLALYRSLDAQGRAHLPALRNDEILGTAGGDQIKIAIRDNGTFMDPRSQKDWWQPR